MKNALQTNSTSLIIHQKQLAAHFPQQRIPSAPTENPSSLRAQSRRRFMATAETKDLERVEVRSGEACWRFSSP